MATTAARAGAAAAGDRFAAVHTHTPHASKVPKQDLGCRIVHARYHQLYTWHAGMSEF